MKSSFEVANYFFAVCIFAYAIFSLIRAFKYLKSENSRASFFGLLSIAMSYALLLLVDWPGFVSQDEFFIWQSLESGGFNFWNSISYSSLLYSLRFLLGTPFSAAIFNALLFLNLIAILFSIVRWKASEPLYWLLCFILMTPHVQLLTLLQNRDSTYSLLLLIFVFGLLQHGLRQTKHFKIYIAEIVVLGIVLSEMRQEGVFFAVVTPFLIYYITGTGYVTLVKSGTAIIVSSLVLFFILPTYFAKRIVNTSHRATVFINPVSYIIQNKGIDSLSTEQKINIDNYISLKALVEHYSPYEIEAFHKEGSRPMALIHYDKFQQTSLEIIFANLDLYFQNRWALFKRIFNFDGFALVENQDYLREPIINSKFNDVLEKLNHKAKSEKRNIVQLMFYKVRNGAFYGLPRPLHLIINSGLIPLLGLFTVLVVGYFSELKFFGVLSALILFRTFLVVAVMPATQFKYIVSTWLGGWLLLIVALKVFQTKHSDKSVMATQK